MTRPLWLATLALLPSLALAGDWPQWRGPAGDGVSPDTGVPVKWSDTENVLWKCPLPDAASAPAIWGHAIFVTGQDGDALLLFRVDSQSGKVIWRKQVGTGSPLRMPLRGKSPQERREQRFHELHNMTSPSPLTDGERVVVHYGNGDLAAYDFDGNPLWHNNLQKDHGTYTIWWGHANSPVLVGELVICACMQDSLADFSGEPSPSYLVAYDKRTGVQKWKTMRMTGARSEPCDSYITPVVRKAGGHDEVVVMGGRWLDAYDPASGKQLWCLAGLGGNRVITGPTVAHGLVYATEGQRGPLFALRPEGEGHQDAKQIVWKHTQGTPDTPCPVVWKDLLFWVADNGVASCLDAMTGAEKWRQRLPGEYKSSPLAAEGRIYFLNLTGNCTVVAAGPTFSLLAENQINDEMVASPAVADGKLFLRGRSGLYCIGAR